MKKTFAHLFAGASWVLTIVGYSHAQGLNSLAKQDQPLTETYIFSTIGVHPIADASNERRNELNAKAVRNFTREYENVQDVKWTKSANGFNVAYFTNDGVKTWVFYTKKGNYLGRGCFYAEDKLPPHIRHRVKNTYYDASICYVTEVFWNDKLVFVISTKDEHSKDKISYKIISVVDGGEMEVMKEFSEKLNDKD